MNSIESTDSIKRAVYWFLVIFIFKTRMHSSRMRTTRYSGHPRGVMDLPGGVCSGGVSVQGGVCPDGGICPYGGICPGGLHRRVSAQGVSAQERVSAWRGMSAQEGGVCPGRGCLPRRGVSAQEGGVCPGGGCLPRRGVSAQGVYHTPHEQND